MSTPQAASVASGLAPQRAGALAHAHLAALPSFAGVLLVTEAQIRAAAALCYRRGLAAEAAGAAALAAVMGGQVRRVEYTILY